CDGGDGGVLPGGSVVTVFFRLLESGVDSKQQALLRAVAAVNRSGPNELLGSAVHEGKPDDFSEVPGSPFAYWVSSNVRAAFSRYPPLGGPGRKAWVGLQTNDDFRWIRLWWECKSAAEHPAGLVPFAKGGRYSQFYADVYLGVRWGTTGRWVKEWKSDELRREKITANNSRCWNETHYFRPGLTW